MKAYPILHHQGFDQTHVVHEQFSNYGYCLGGQYDYIKHGPEDNSMLVFHDDKKVIIPASEVPYDEALLLSVIEASHGKQVWIKYCSPEQLQDVFRMLENRYILDVYPRLPEAVYDVKGNINLTGSHYAKLRNKKRKIQSDNCFETLPLDDTTYEAALAIVELWRNKKSGVYIADRTLAEVGLIRAIANRETGLQTSGEVLFYAGTPAGLMITDASRDDTLIGVMTKGINDSHYSGTGLASTYLYFRMFDIANEAGLSKINDGGVGTEQGTVDHKSGFRPTFTRSYDIQVTIAERSFNE